MKKNYIIFGVISVIILSYFLYGNNENKTKNTVITLESKLPRVINENEVVPNNPVQEKNTLTTESLKKIENNLQEIEVSEIIFEEILYPEDYDFKAVNAGEVYEEAGTKIKADFSFMLEKKTGDEVSFNFLGENITGVILILETDNGPEDIKYYNYQIDTNNSALEDGRIPEQVNVSIFEQNGKLISVDGNYDTPYSDGMFMLANNVGYFVTKEDYGKIAPKYIQFD